MPSIDQLDTTFEVAPKKVQPLGFIEGKMSPTTVRKFLRLHRRPKKDDWPGDEWSITPEDDATDDFIEELYSLQNTTSGYRRAVKWLYDDWTTTHIAIQVTVNSFVTVRDGQIIDSHEDGILVKIISVTQYKICLETGEVIHYDDTL